MFRTPSYRFVATLCAALFATLAATLLAAPGLIFWLFSLESSDSAAFLSRRAAILFVALSFALFWTKDHQVSETRIALAKAIAFAMVCLAGLGVFEWARGNVGAGISLAVATELVVAMALIKAK